MTNRFWLLLPHTLSAFAVVRALTCASLGVNMAVGQAVDMSLMDISKIFSLLQPKEDNEGNELSQALNNAVSSDNVIVLSKLLSQESYRRSINIRSGWGVPVTPLRTAATLGHLRCLELLLEHGAEVRYKHLNCARRSCNRNVQQLLYFRVRILLLKK